MKKHAHTFIALAVLGVMAPGAWAQKADSWSASIGVTHIQPKVSSGVLTASMPNAQVDLTSTTQFTGALNYSATDNVNLHVPFGFGFRHDIVGAGNPLIAAQGKLGDVRVLPLTLIGQYRFMDADDNFRPYIGAGLTYAKFYKERGTAALTAATNPGGAASTLTIASRTAATLQFGGVLNLNEKVYLEASYTKTFLKTRATLSPSGQTIDVRLDPNGYTLQAGYRF